MGPESSQEQQLGFLFYLFIAHFFADTEQALLGSSRLGNDDNIRVSGRRSAEGGYGLIHGAAITAAPGRRCFSRP